VDLDQAGQSADFDAGASHLTNGDSRANLGSITLAQQGESYTGQVLAASRRPNSVLAPLAFSGEQSANGTAGDASHWHPGFGVLGTANGMSAENFDQSLNLKFLGGDREADLG
jgi:hypothetical protein